MSLILNAATGKTVPTTSAEAGKSIDLASGVRSTINEAASPSTPPSAAVYRALRDSATQLGPCPFTVGSAKQALHLYEEMLRIDPASREGHAGLYYAYSALGDKHRAVSHLGQAMQWPAILTLPYRGSEPPIPVLLLLSMNAGNVLIQRFLNDRIFQTYVVIVEFFEPSVRLPFHRLVVNGVGDADVRAEALSSAQGIIARTAAPVINPPDAVLATGRSANAERLARIPGVVSPQTALFSREQLQSPDAVDALMRSGFSFPLLIRAPGYHQGKHFVRVDSPELLTGALVDLPGDELIVIQFLDSRSADGKIRKYRVMMIDGRFYPVHLAISRQWKIHYFSAEMAHCPEHRAEEAEFLGNMSRVLGPRTMAALEQIQSTLGLDYGGIDFGLNQSGELLLFEANATMAVYRPDSNSQWDYRRAAIERIYEAVPRMFRTRASSNSIENQDDPAQHDSDAASNRRTG